MLENHLAFIATQTSKLVHKAYAMRQELYDLQMKTASLSSIIDSRCRNPKVNDKVMCKYLENNNPIANTNVDNSDPISITFGCMEADDHSKAESFAEQKVVKTRHNMIPNRQPWSNNTNEENTHQKRFDRIPLVRQKKYVRKQRWRKGFSPYQRYKKMFNLYGILNFWFFKSYLRRNRKHELNDFTNEAIEDEGKRSMEQNVRHPGRLAVRTAECCDLK